MPRLRASKNVSSTPSAPSATAHQNGKTRTPETELPAAKTIFSPFKSPRQPDFDPDDPEYIKELQRPAVIKVHICFYGLLFGFMRYSAGKVGTCVEFRKI